jgi:hypothetical protein
VSAGSVCAVVSRGSQRSRIVGNCTVGELFGTKSRARRAQQDQRPIASNSSDKNPADAGTELRRLMLTLPPQKLGVSPSQEAPRVYGILMDWPIGAQTATIFSSSAGSASLYTTSTFGIIGGEGHASVRAASAAFVNAAQRFYESATPVSEYPYPVGDKVRFYLLTFDGVRVIETDIPSATHGEPHAELFGLGQNVMTELRVSTDKKTAPVP